MNAHEQTLEKLRGQWLRRHIYTDESKKKLASRYIAQLEAELKDYNETYQKVMDEECAPDEQHCTCVPFLRKRIGELEAEQGIIVIGDGLRVGKAWTENLLEEKEQLKAENEWITTLQDRIFEWGRETFGPGQRSGGVFAHLVREISELGKSMPEIDPDELADCAILLFELAGFAGVQLLDEVEKKFAINRERKWGPIEADGSILHIEANDDR